MNRAEILAWLHEPDLTRLEELWRLADAARRLHVGDAVHLRGLVEFSNICAARCLYCGLRAGRRSLARYRMTTSEITEAAREAAARGYGTVVMQSGEDPGLDAGWLGEVVRRIKTETPLAITLSCGERSPSDLALWRQAGADRYLLRFETSNTALYRRIRPARDRRAPHRLEMLQWIRDLGYETGSGIMVGIPGQTWESVADDIEWFRRLDLDMIGIGPYLPHTETPLGRAHRRAAACPGPEQVPNDALSAVKVLALARLTCPRANIPSTTALATVDRELGWETGLRRGANVLMINVTPQRYRSLYEIYPAKACIGESASEQKDRVAALLERLGRTGGQGPGASPNYAARCENPRPTAKIRVQIEVRNGQSWSLATQKVMQCRD